MHTTYWVTETHEGSRIPLLTRVYTNAKKGTKNLKWVMWRHHANFRDGLSSVGWDLLRSTHIKFEMSTITCNEDMKGNAKCKNSRFEPPFGDLGVTYMAWWKAPCSLPISDNWTVFASSHGWGTINIKQNLLKSAFPDRVGYFEQKF